MKTIIVLIEKWAGAGTQLTADHMGNQIGMATMVPVTAMHTWQLQALPPMTFLWCSHLFLPTSILYFFHPSFCLPSWWLWSNGKGNSGALQMLTASCMVQHLLASHADPARLFLADSNTMICLLLLYYTVRANSSPSNYSRQCYPVGMQIMPQLTKRNIPWALDPKKKNPTYLDFQPEEWLKTKRWMLFIQTCLFFWI